ncbi:hypothetical protein SVAN01_04961 [Stagonosporopsis vannaccii]|nr:hypothetical protein SVAN01_04961 [Stagonosporopsis vannaccii]
MRPPKQEAPRTARPDRRSTNVAATHSLTSLVSRSKRQACFAVQRVSTCPVSRDRTVARGQQSHAWLPSVARRKTTRCPPPSAVGLRSSPDPTLVLCCVVRTTVVVVHAAASVRRAPVPSLLHVEMATTQPSASTARPSLCIFATAADPTVTPCGLRLMTKFFEDHARRRDIYEKELESCDMVLLWKMRASPGMAISLLA